MGGVGYSDREPKQLQNRRNHGNGQRRQVAGFDAMFMRAYFANRMRVLWNFCFQFCRYIPHRVAVYIELSSMSTFARRSVGTLDIAGGVVATTLFVLQLVAMPSNFFAYLVVSAYIAVACWGVLAGVLLLEQDPRARWHNLMFWSCQVPVLFLPGIGHKLGIGAFLFAWVEYPLRFAFFFGTGAEFKFRLFKIEDPTIVGVNLIALAIAYGFYRTAPPTHSVRHDGT